MMNDEFVILEIQVILMRIVRK